MRPPEVRAPACPRVFNESIARQRSVTGPSPRYGGVPRAKLPMGRCSLILPASALAGAAPRGGGVGMEEAREALQIGGRSFETTADGHVRVDDVRRHVGELADRLASLESENADLRRQLDHVSSLQRLAEATVVKADDLAAEIEATARAR